MNYLEEQEVRITLIRLGLTILVTAVFPVGIWYLYHVGLGVIFEIFPVPIGILYGGIVILIWWRD